MILAERVARRFMAAEPKGLIYLIHSLTVAAGGVGFLARKMDPEGLPSWDKAKFYQGLGDQLLRDIVETATSNSLAKFLQPFWDRSGSTEGALDEDWLHLEWDDASSKITLELRAWGPSFERYAEEPGPDRDDFGSYVEVPEREAFLDDHLRKFAAQLGGKLGHVEKRRMEAGGGWGEYDQYRYDTELTWKVSSEALLRQSVGKWVIQAGEATQWRGDRD